MGSGLPPSTPSTSATWVPALDLQDPCHMGCQDAKAVHLEVHQLIRPSKPRLLQGGACATSTGKQPT